MGRYLELHFWLLAHTIGIFLFSIVYLMSFIIRPLKPTLAEYKEFGTAKSIFIITLISMTIYSSVIFGFVYYPDVGFFEMALFFIAWFFNGISFLISTIRL